MVEQLELIDVSPEGVKGLLVLARKYRTTVSQRLAIQKKEAEQKTELREAIEASEIQPLENGKIAFECDGVMIEHAPQDATIKVTITD